MNCAPENGMHVIGKIKLNKGWSLIRGADGHLMVGYQCNLPPLKEALKLHADGLEYVAEHGRTTGPVDDPMPNREYKTFKELMKTSPSYRGPAPLTEESEAAIKAWNERQDERNRIRALINWADKKPLTYNPVYEEWLEFTGYSRGRSSTTMNFVSKSGQEISLAPTGIDGFIRAISDGRVKVCKSGLFLVRFVFVKQGQNVYASIYDGPFDPVAS